MNKTDLAGEILESLLDIGLVTLDCGSELYDQCKQECIKEIKQKLDDYVIVDGRAIE